MSPFSPYSALSPVDPGGSFHQQRQGTAERERGEQAALLSEPDRWSDSMQTRLWLLPTIALSFVIALACPAGAQWQRDGVPVCMDSSNQYSPALAPDGASGALVFWVDRRNGMQNIYGQHIDATGHALWTVNGVQISSSAGSQDSPVAVSDGVGGAIVAYDQFVGTGKSHIYAQRVNSNGVPQWGTGVAIGPTDTAQYKPAILPPNKHGILVGQTPGAIIAWIDGRNAGKDHDLYIEAIDNTGTARWAAEAVDASASDVDDVSMVTDAVGSASTPKGAILTWLRLSTNQSATYAQRIASDGTEQWGANGVPAGASSFDQIAPVVASVGAGRAIFEWEDLRNSSKDIYGQYLGSGTWQVDGLPISRAPGAQSHLSIVPDGAGGAISVWIDARFQAADIFAQRVDVSGSPVWTLDGVPVSLVPGALQTEPVLVTDYASGAVVVWLDTRLGHANLFAQHLDASGAALWADGFPVASVGYQDDPRVISDDLGGAIVACRASRSAAADAYAPPARVVGSICGAGPPPPLAFRALSPFPNPASVAATLRFELPAPARVSAEIVDVQGHVVRDLMAGQDLPAGIQTLYWGGRRTSGEHVPNRVYLFCVDESNQTAREKVLFVGANR